MIVLPLNGALRQFRHCKEGQGKDEGGARRRTTLLMPFITAATLLRTCTRICIVILGSWASKGSLVCSPIHQTPCANVFLLSRMIMKASTVSSMPTSSHSCIQRAESGIDIRPVGKKSCLRSEDNQFDNGALPGLQP